MNLDFEILKTFISDEWTIVNWYPDKTKFRGDKIDIFLTIEEFGKIKSMRKIIRYSDYLEAKRDNIISRIIN